MQTPLLGLAIAIILALLAALVGPLLIDWGGRRSLFEAEASRLIGVDVRVTGKIDARLLPSPQLTLQLTRVLHELAINALHHGALSAARGELAIAWALTTKGDVRWLELTWCESGGPSVSPPPQCGYGVTLIKRCGHSQNFKTTLDFAPGGVTCLIEAEVPAVDGASSQLFNPGRQSRLRARQDRAPQRKARQPKSRTLIVEDDALSAMEIEEALADAGFRTVGPVTSSAAAIAAIETGEVDAAVVADKLIGEPIDPVLELLGRKQIPFVLLKDCARSDKAEAFAPSVVKPVQPTALTDALREVLTAKSDVAEV